jgi:ribonucleoside-triphosphate reductase
MALKCKEETEVFNRVVGFYRPVQEWNIGKKAEWEDRKKGFFKIPKKITHNKSQKHPKVV